MTTALSQSNPSLDFIVNVESFREDNSESNGCGPARLKNSVTTVIVKAL